MEIRHLLFMETGGHDWKLVKSTFKFTDPKGQEYVVEKCTQCGITGQRYIFPDRDNDSKDKALKSIYIGPQYPRECVIKCPEEMGFFKHPEDGALIAVLGGGEGKVTKTKKKHKKKKKDKKKKDKKVKIIRTRNTLKKGE